MSVGSDPGRPDVATSAVGQLLALLGLSGFAVSQPLLAVAGEDPSLFTFADVRGGQLVAFAVLVAFVPPLVLWFVVVAARRIDLRAGDAVFTLFAGALAAAAVSQWLWAAGLDHRLGRAVVAVAVAVAFVVLLRRARAVALWVRYTALLPVLAVALFLAASPSSALLRSTQTASTAGPSDLPPVVFILLDELPLVTLLDEQGGIDRVRYPNLAGFADEATWYRNYTVMSSHTLRSVPSILTGRAPEDVPALWTSHPDNLFSLLAPTHELDVVEVVTELCGFSNCGIEGAAPRSERGLGSLIAQMDGVWRERVGLAPSRGPDLGQFATELEPVDPGEAEPTEDALAVARPTDADDFIDSLGGAEPTLSYLHLMLPHQPWALTPDGGPMRGLSVAEFAYFGATVDAWAAALLQQAHLFQMEYTDRLIGDILDRLREVDRYDDAIVVITSDHGIRFGPEGVDRSLVPGAFGEVAFVPLLVKAPGQRAGTVDESNVMAVDLLPTLAELVGVPMPFEVDGLAAGSDAQLARGDQKEIYDFGPELRPSFAGIREISADDVPSYDERAVGAVEPDEHPLAALARTIDADRWLGRDVGDLATTDGPEDRPAATIATTPGGIVAGILDVTIDAADGIALLAIDGIVESVAPVQEGGQLRFFVPPHAAGSGADALSLFFLRGDEAAEIPLELLEL